MGIKEQSHFCAFLDSIPEVLLASANSSSLLVHLSNLSLFLTYFSFYFLPGSFRLIFFFLLISSGFPYLEVCIYSSPHCRVFNNWEVSPPKAFCYRKKKKMHSIICLHYPKEMKAAPSKSFFRFLEWPSQQRWPAPRSRRPALHSGAYLPSPPLLINL